MKSPNMFCFSWTGPDNKHPEVKEFLSIGGEDGRFKIGLFPKGDQSNVKLPSLKFSKIGDGP